MRDPGSISLPATIVADKQGVVRYRMVGFDPDNAYRKLKAVVDSLNVAFDHAQVVSWVIQ